MAERKGGKRTGYSSYIDYYPRYRTYKRITMPSVPRRPLRFQIRTLIRRELLKGEAGGVVVHRRGIFRSRVGGNPLEARAIPKGVIKGYLTERILYATLVNNWHFVHGIDFLFQSSVEGGRLEMGGLVADFLFPILRIVINPLGPQHYQFRNMKKDEEQVQILAEMGYQVYLIDEEVIYDEYQLEEFLRRIFGGMTSGGSDQGGHPANETTISEQEGYQHEQLYQDILGLQESLHSVF